MWFLLYSILTGWLFNLEQPAWSFGERFARFPQRCECIYTKSLMLYFIFARRASPQVDVNLQWE